MSTNYNSKSSQATTILPDHIRFCNSYSASYNNIMYVCRQMLQTKPLFTGENIFPLIWEVIEALELHEIPVVSLTSDGAKSNRRVYNLCQLNDHRQKGSIPYKTVNLFREEENLYFFCDAPHLLKTARNCFSNSFAHSQSRRMKVKSTHYTFNF